MAETLYDRLKELMRLDDRVASTNSWMNKCEEAGKALPHLLAVVEAAHELAELDVLRNWAALATALGPLFEELPDD